MNLYTNYIPTVGFNVEEITFHNLIMMVWDVGGQKMIRYVMENNTFGMSNCITSII